MADSALIKLWDETVGAVVWSEDDQTGRFEFDPKFLRTAWDISPIKMPLSKSRSRIYRFPENRGPGNAFKGLPGLIADALPDKYANALINIWLSMQGKSRELNPVETLCFIGSRGMGALEFHPAIGDIKKKSELIEIDSLVTVANKILHEREEFNTSFSTDEQMALSQILQIGTSAGGARAKAIIAYNEKTKEVRSGQVKAPKGFGYWMIKFDGVMDSQFGASQGYGRVEMAYHQMAVAAGIEMTACRLLEENGRAHFMTERFDRDQEGEKIHMQSLHAIRHFDFNMVGYYSYEQVFETMRMLGLPYPQAEQMYLRMLFNVLARNCDDHTKNFAFLMNKEGNWKISPAYDICHAYRPGSPWVSSQSLTVNGKRENIGRKDLLAVAKSMNIRNANQLIDQVNDVVLQWDAYAKGVDLQTDLRKSIKSTLLAI